MNKIQITKKLLIVILLLWVVLWLFFIVREDKDGQYSTLGALYKSPNAEKTATIYGKDFYDFFVFCQKAMPKDASYEILGFDKYSIDEVRARYLLWPAKAGTCRPDFKIVYGRGRSVPAGYLEFKSYNKGKKGYLYVRKGIRV